MVISLIEKIVVMFKEQVGFETTLIGKSRSDDPLVD